MSSVYAVRRRLTESLHRAFIDEMRRREMPESVAIDALMLANGDERLVHAALDFVGAGRSAFLDAVDCTRILDHLRRDGRQL